MHSPHLTFRLGHDRTRVSTVPKIATQTPTSVRSASVDMPCDWTDGPAVESRFTACAITAAWVVEMRWSLISIRIRALDMLRIA